MSDADAVVAALRSGYDSLAGLVTRLRLGPAYTPAGVTATGAADLDLLRKVFPGY